MEIKINLPETKQEFISALISEIFCMDTHYEVEKLHHDHPGMEQTIKQAVFGFKRWFMVFGDGKRPEWLELSPDLVNDIFMVATKQVADLYGDYDYFASSHG